MKNIILASLLLLVSGSIIAKDKAPEDEKKDQPKVILATKSSCDVVEGNCRGLSDVLKGLAGLSLFSDHAPALKDMSVAVFVASLCAATAKNFSLKKGLLNKNGFNGLYIASGALFGALCVARAALLLNESHNKPVAA